MSLTSQRSWLVALGSTTFVACSVYSTDLLITDDNADGLHPSASNTALSPSGTLGGSHSSAASSTSGQAMSAASGSVSAPKPSDSPNTSSSAPDVPATGDSTAPSQTDPGDAGPSPEPTASDVAPDPSDTVNPPASSIPSPVTSVPSATPPADPSSIEDFEDGNTQLLKRGNRNGYWFTSAGNPDDALAMITGPTSAQLIVAPEPAGDANDTKKAAHVVATGISVDDGAHAELGVNFVNPPTGETLASAYAEAGTYIGISFRARVGDDSVDATQTVRFAVPTTATAADSDHFAKDISITKEWVQYYVQWADADFVQQGFGVPEAFVAAEATGLQFKLVNGADSLDLWVDDVAFIPAQ